MNKVCLSLVLVFSLNAVVCGQEKAPDLLIHAAQCLSAKQFLPSSEATTLRLGYLIDEKSYPGDRVLYLVYYTHQNHDEGYVFSIFLTHQGDRQIFDVQNNASYMDRTAGDEIDFPNPPLEGTWTQKHLAAAIRQIERQPSFSIPVSDLSVPSPISGCMAYTDKQ